MRVSRKRLKTLKNRVASLQDRPHDVWVRQANGKLKANVGALHLDYVSMYGGWDLVEITNKHGGENSLFTGHRRLKAYEMETFLLGMLSVLEHQPAHVQKAITT